MRKISAHFILDGRGKSYNKGILTVDENGTIVDIHDTHGILNESAGVEFFSGILVPGFVNAHCHLELSHMKSRFDEGEGFVAFIKQVTQSRNNDPAKILLAAQNADLQMYKNGIVAVGDISNESSVFEVKYSSKINYYTFIEALGVVPDRAEMAFDHAKSALKAAEQMGLKAGIVPHAPYSISKPLFEAIAAEAVRNDSILSIHSQETTEEDELFRTGSGGIAGHLQDNLSIDTSFFCPTGESALYSTLRFLPSVNNLLLVHNLNTSQSDIDFIAKVRMLCKTWFVLCPASNLYIQNKLPDIGLLRENQLQICLGTDSLGSNHQLSILEEMRIIQSAYPDLPLSELITWATFNGATALKMADWAGSIEVGKRPGLNLLTGLNMNEKKLQSSTRVKKIG
jgi:cytosine/adenosine deaminase-related metal-dependent hydrolase